MNKTIDQYCEDLVENIIYPPRGMLSYHYITPSKIKKGVIHRELGNYTQQYDWDTFFIGIAISKSVPEKINFFKEALLNFLAFTTDSGKTPRTISPIKFWDPYDQHKPFLAQGCLLVSETLNDYSWIDDWIWNKLISFLRFWEETRGFHGLARWKSALESGPDNNPTIVNLPNYAAESVDINCYLFKEYEAMAKIAQQLGKDSKEWEQKMNLLKIQINSTFWDEEEGIYYDVNNFSDTDIDFIKVKSWTCFLPLWAEVASKKQAEILVKKHIMSSEFLSLNGLRTIPNDNPIYNTAKRWLIYEHSENRRRVISNWQGPVWILPNWLITIGLAKYGYKKEAEEIAKRVIKLLQKDLKETGTMHENYDPETGKGLWSPDFGSWNLLAWKWMEDLKKI